MGSRGKKLQPKKNVCDEGLDKKREQLFLLQRENARRIAAEKTRKYGTKLLTHSQQMVLFLRATKESIITDIKNAGSEKNMDLYRDQATKIMQLMTEMDNNKNFINILKKERNEINDQCKKIAKVVYQKQLEYKAIFGQRKTEPQMEKKVFNLENTLYNITVHTNLLFVKVGNMREDIQNQLIHRNIYYKRMKFVVNETKRDAKKLRKVMNKTKRNFSDREELIDQTKTICDHESKAILHHQSDLTEIGRIQADDEEHESFIISKNKERGTLEDEHARKVRIERQREEKIDNEIQFCMDITHELIAATNTNNLYFMMEMLKYYDDHLYSEVTSICDANAEVSAVLEDILRIKNEMEQDAINKIDLEFKDAMEVNRVKWAIRAAMNTIRKLGDQRESQGSPMEIKLPKNSNKEDEEGVLEDKEEDEDENEDEEWVREESEDEVDEKEDEEMLYDEGQEQDRDLYHLNMDVKEMKQVLSDLLGSQKASTINPEDLEECFTAIANHYTWTKKQFKIFEIKRKRDMEGVRYYRRYDRTRFPFRKVKARGGPYKPKLTFVRKNEDSSEEEVADRFKYNKKGPISRVYMIDAKLEVLEEILEKGVEAMGVSARPSYMKSFSSGSSQN